MCILEKEFKRKTRKKKNEKRETKSYKPRSTKFFIGKNDKRDPVPSYRTFV